jgi:hypothetical protein
MAKYSSFVIAVIIGFGKDRYNPRQFEMHPASYYFWEKIQYLILYLCAPVVMMHSETS